MKRSLPLIIIGVVLIGAVVLTVVLLKKRSGSAEVLTNQATTETSSPGAAANSPSQTAANSEVPVTKPNVKTSSPVLLDEYGDYQCPPCGLLYPELKKIESDYGDQLQIVFHHFPLAQLHKNAIAAARAAEAARNQNKFWEMHDRLYRNQKVWADLPDPRPTFISYAQQLGLNVEQFTRDMDSADVQQRILADQQRGASLGVTGTPTVFIDGHMLRAEATNADGVRRGINVMMEKKAVS
jgi:protein-disulfide isomerase